MNRNSDNELDFLFKSKLATESDDDLLELGWENMEDILEPEPKKKRGVIWLYRISGGVAASLLFFLSLYFMQHTPVKHRDDVIKNVYASHKRQSPNNNGQSGGLALYTNTGSDISTDLAKTKHHAINTKALLDNGLADSANRGDTIIQTLDPALASEKLFIDKNLTGKPVNIDSAMGVAMIADAKKPEKTRTITSSRFALAVLAAPDINGVGSFGNNRAGLDFAVQLSVKLTSRLSISTGAAYTIKPYQTGLGNYRKNSPGWSAGLWTSNAKPNIVNANCYVLDIPLNINYQLYSKGVNSFTVSTGLSSYLMLKEDYSFNFPDPAKNAVDLNIANQNQHLLSVLNLEATYQRRFSNKLGLVLQPYLKLPLTQIGFGQVNLQSAGVAVGFSWNMR